MRNMMPYVLLLAIFARPAVGQTPKGFLGEGGILSKSEVDDGWIALFDGETLFGWRPQPSANFRVQDKAIVVERGGQCLLCTTTQFADYVLKVEFRCDETTNSGIFLRTSPKPGNVKRDCFELNIAPPDNPFPTGSFVGRKKYEGHKPDGEWHQYEVTMEGNKATVKLDGTVILEYEDDDAVGRGFIGLQHNSGYVAFRNVKLKPIGTKPIFNETDLTGWKSYPEMNSEFTVSPEGFLSMKNGKGQLETENKYGDFVLQIEAISHGAKLNSGVFFRCIPGDEMNGYESQIQNGFNEGDRTKPMDAGTGAIFRRTRCSIRCVERFRMVFENDYRRRPSHSGLGQRLSGDGLGGSTEARQEPAAWLPLGAWYDHSARTRPHDGIFIPRHADCGNVASLVDSRR